MIVIYHANCYDGFAAAWLFHLAFGSAAEFHPASYGDDPPDVKGKIVFIADFSYSREQMIEMNQQAESMLVLDHHKSAQENCAGLDFCVFDMEKSGAMLAWLHLVSERHLGMDVSTEVKWLIDYIQDRDLWLHQLPDSKAINAAIRSYPLDFQIWRKMASRGPDALKDQGIAIERYRKKIIAEHVKNAHEIQLAGFKIKAAYCSNADIVSEVAGQLAEGSPFGACYYNHEGRRVYSLRSREGGIDVAELAGRLGGGGHKHAAGFSLPL